MSVDILEVLMSAEHNFKNANVAPIAQKIALEQLHNAIVLLQKGYSPYDAFDELMVGHETVDSVPDKPDTD